MLLIEYASLVHERYKTRREDGSPSSRLIQPTPAGLRDECIAVYTERPDKKDDGILRTFFGPYDHEEDRITKMEQVKPGKFKPLIKFLQRPTTRTNVKNIDLLAWLIDFQPRPFALAQQYAAASLQPPDIGKKDASEKKELPKKESPKLAGGIPKEEIPEEEGTTEIAPPTIEIRSKGYTGGPPIITVSGSGKPEPRPGKKTVILSIVLALAAGLIIFLTTGRKTSLPALTGNEKCMYWAGDHYEPVSCSQKMDGILVVALDSERVHHFRKITQTDTITYRSKGAVWYVKVRGTIEFYTSDGFHPIETQLRLRPVTDYIINKYILANN